MDLKKARKISIIIYSVFAVLMLLMIITLKAPFGIAAAGRTYNNKNHPVSAQRQGEVYC